MHIGTGIEGEAERYFSVFAVLPYALNNFQSVGTHQYKIRNAGLHHRVEGEGFALDYLYKRIDIACGKRPDKAIDIAIGLRKTRLGKRVSVH